ncbi:MAG: alkaline phosphatase family protein, partial [Acidobacteriota bacterium]
MTLRHFITLSILAAIFFMFGCGGVTSSPDPGPAPGPGPGPSPQPGIESLNHIIFMVQENRSFDEYFGMLNAYRQANGMPQDVDGLPPTASNPTLNGKGIIPAFHMISACTEAPSPSWNESHVDFNRKAPTLATATMDGFVTTAARTAIAGGFHDRTGMRAMGFYDSNDLPYYYFIASNFATSDRWFSPVMSRTDPNRMYLLSGTSAGHAYALPPGSPPL